MPRVTIDLSEAQSRKPIPDDTYPAEITSITGPHKGSKSQYLKVELTISEGDFAKRKLFVNLPVTGAGAGIFADFLSKVTGEEIDVDELENLDIDTDDLIGMEVGVQTKQKEYPEGSGEMVSEVAKVLRNR